MAKSIIEIIPDPEALLELEPEEVAGIVIEHLNSLEPMNTGNLNRYNFSLPHTYEQFPQQYHKRIAECLMEGWMWLEREGMLAPKPGDTGDWYFITRRGKQINNASDLDAYRQSNRLPKQMLHGKIAQKVWSLYLRGDYDVAVFQSFKELEVAVRDACGFPASDIGTSLMRKAFDAESGPLRDTTLPKSEGEALAHLFAGAIGIYKNPHSHRAVTIEADEATEMIMLASHLLNIVDARKT